MSIFNKKSKDAEKDKIMGVDWSRHFSIPPPLLEKDQYAYSGIEFLIRKAKEAKRENLKGIDISLLKESVSVINKYISMLESDKEEETKEPEPERYFSPK